MTDLGSGPAGRALDLIKRYGRWLLLAVGVVAVVVLVREAGPDHVLDVLGEAAPWLPLILVLEVAWISMDAVALRLMFRERGTEVPWSAWLRSASLAYGVMVLLPVGRAGGEVARAAQLSKHVGMLAATAAGQLQGSTLFANAVISVPCLVTVASGVGIGHTLAILIALNGVATGVVGVLVMFATSRSRLGQRLGRWFSFLKPFSDQLDEATGPMKAFPKRAVLCTVTGRVIQTVQYGIILLAIGGKLTVGSALVAQGIHLVGAGFGEMVPNAVGITETAYRLFADTLGFGDDPARAIAIALVARLAQYSLAAVALLAGAGGDPRRAVRAAKGDDDQ